MEEYLQRYGMHLIKVIVLVMVSGCVPQRPKPVVADLFQDLTGGSVTIGNRGRIPFHCGDSLIWISSDTRVFSSVAIKELSEKWQFIPLGKGDSSLFFIGNTTPDFNLWGYDSTGKKVWTMGVFYNGEELFGLYHSELGAFKPLRKETSCYYMLPFTR